MHLLQHARSLISDCDWLVAKLASLAVTVNNQSVSLVATTNIKQDRQKIWQPTVGEVLVVLKAANKQESSPPPVQTKKIVCIEQILARPYVPCNLALAPLILVNYSVQFYFLVRDMHCCGHVLIMTTPTNITSGCNMNTIADIGVSRSGCNME